MHFLKTKLEGVFLIEAKVFFDDRGYFMETYSRKLFQKNGIVADFVQDNMSKSVQGTLRGLHYQLDPYAQGKLVRVVKGAVFDVAVDIRSDSSTFGKWIGFELSEERKNSLYIPPGFAHGFYVLTKEAEFIYKCTAQYAPQAEHGIIWNDPEINIKWPIKEGKIILSKKDRALPSLSKAKVYEQ